MQLTFSTFLHLVLCIATTSNLSSPKSAVPLIPSVVSRNLELERTDGMLHVLLLLLYVYSCASRFFTLQRQKRMQQHVLHAVVRSWNVTVARKPSRGHFGWLDIPGNSSVYQIITTTFSHLSRLDQKQAHLKRLSKTTSSSETHYQWFFKALLLSGSIVTTKYSAKHMDSNVHMT